MAGEKGAFGPSGLNVGIGLLRILAFLHVAWSGWRGVVFWG